MKQQRIRPVSEYTAVLFSIAVILFFLRTWFTL